MTHYADRTDLFPMQGGCPCGHIRYQVNLPPLLVQTCHCTVCQRQMGSAFALNAIIESSAISLLPSAPLTTPLSKADASLSSSSSALAPGSVCGVLPAFADFTNAATTATVPPAAVGRAVAVNSPVLVAIPTQSKVGQTVAQCPVCRGNLWSYYADGGLLVTYLIASTLDRPWELEPDVHIFTRSRRDFITINDGKPQFEGQYPDRAAFYRPETKDRVGALMEKQAAWKKKLRAAYKAQFAKI
ncbi:glutathione-dependent formaldehyde-activating [Trichoderma arundinaceum]|uniref:Glutathione-dependent formaldehyde-activating n=1 Tax=Trichoderma arundinaceum TaxID=490622 RepID=A0A395NHR4_TRIAR|nr:glutathione-dependent formaldehyde-activating [Trichoderma arundinaceum]